tara:strand:- start:3450 stop:3992 length:543 start_codon:yes stop_codon:yes gene_type:complete
MKVIEHILQDYPWLSDTMLVTEFVAEDNKIFNNLSKLEKFIKLQSELTEIDGTRKNLFTSHNLLGKSYVEDYFESTELSDVEKTLINNTIDLIANSILLIDNMTKIIRNPKSLDADKNNALKTIYKENARLQHLIFDNFWDIDQGIKHISGLWWKVSGATPVKNPFLYNQWCKFLFWLNT